MRIHHILTVILFFIAAGGVITGQDSKTVVYLIPGQGADSRQFSNLRLDEQFEIRNIEYFTPDDGWGMKDFARALSQQVDTTRSFILVGVSLGGMIATEMGDFLNPEKIILISSAKCRDELPGRYRFQKSIPLYRCVGPRLVKSGAKFLQPIVEPDSKYDRTMFKSMINDKDPLFLKRTVAMIIRWERDDYRRDIIHIHGDKDHTLPSGNVDYDYLVPGGSHMMVYTRADEISTLINKILTAE